MRAIRYDVRGRYAIAVGTDGRKLGYVVSCEPGGASCMLTDREPSDLDESANEQIARMTVARVLCARECAKNPTLRATYDP